MQSILLQNSLQLCFFIYCRYPFIFEIKSVFSLFKRILHRKGYHGTFQRHLVNQKVLILKKAQMCSNTGTIGRIIQLPNSLDVLQDCLLCLRKCITLIKIGIAAIQLLQHCKQCRCILARLFLRQCAGG